LRQLEMDPGHPVGSSGSAVNRLDPLRKRRIGCRPLRERPILPRMISAGGDSQQTAHRGYRVNILIRLHESEDLSGIEPVSRANQAAAFDKISRSMRNCRFSRRKRTSSLRSSVVNPSLCLPSSRSAWATQLWIYWAVGSNSLDNASGFLPPRTNSTMRRRNSGGYGGWVFGMMDTSSSNDIVSTKTGQLQLHARPRYNYTKRGRTSSGAFGPRIPLPLARVDKSHGRSGSRTINVQERVPSR
jgi:hypothetical protein